MAKIQRVFLIADFKDELPQSIRIERRHWAKGFVRLGLDVQRFSYRNIMEQLSPVKSRRVAARWGKRRADDALIEQVEHYHPDLVLLLAMKSLDPATIARVRAAAPSAAVVGRDVDWCPQSNPARVAIARCMDLVIASNAGEYLEYYKQQGVPKCAFIPCPCDPDIQRPYAAEARFATDICFAGKPGHSAAAADPDRETILSRLEKMPNARVYGAFDVGRIEGIDTYIAMSNAKVSLSINAVNHVRLYHSDRFVASLSCGAFTLAKRVPDTELLFEDRKHLRYFDTPEEFFELADYYLRHEAERVNLAQEGMERAQRHFNSTVMAAHVLDLVEKGTYSAPWAHIL